MKTSRTIKQAQRQPPVILQQMTGQAGSWRVQGREKPHYYVTRSTDGHKWYCTCQGARHGLCRHVEAVIKSLARQAGYMRVSFWTHLEDVPPQHRSVVEFEAVNHDPFWVTYGEPMLPVLEGYQPIEVRLAWGSDGGIWQVRYRNGKKDIVRKVIDRNLPVKLSRGGWQGDGLDWRIADA